MRIPSLKDVKALFSKSPAALSQRSYRDIVSVGGGINSDWALSQLSDDADIWQNAQALTSRCRDLFKTNPLYIKYRELLWANIFGEGGIMLRMKIKEMEDRVVYAPDEKAALVAHERRINRLREWAAGKNGTEAQQYRAFVLADGLETRSFESVLRGKATIEIGAPDVYANQLVERLWAEWQRAEYCDIRQRRTYGTMRQLRLISGVRDGDFFIRHVRDPRVNKFGYAQQLINAEWCDRFLNGVTPEGNPIRMGIEYANTAWGMGAPVAFYFIRRQPNDWQFSMPGSMGISGPGKFHDRIPADQIMHYARPVDSEGTRPAPWICTTIPKARQLDQYELAEVVAAREQACKTGWLWSDVIPEGGEAVAPIDPRTGLPTMGVSPGGTYGLPFGVKYQGNDPTHPNGNFETFRKGMLRSVTSGMPGADYNILANDLENINFSAGRLGRLDTNEMSKLIQRFDIDTAERPTFEAWLEMGLITGAIPLPLAKFSKFNKPLFQGRRWQGVDAVKEITASALKVANHMSTLGRECAENGVDFEEILMERAEELMMQEQMGIDPTLTVQTPPAALPVNDDEEPLPGTGKPNDKPKPAAKPKA